MVLAVASSKAVDLETVVVGAIVNHSNLVSANKVMRGNKSGRLTQVTKAVLLGDSNNNMLAGLIVLVSSAMIEKQRQRLIRLVFVRLTLR